MMQTAIQSIYVFNNGVPACVMLGVIDTRPFHEIPEEELLNTDVFPLSYEEAMELEEIDAFNDEIERIKHVQEDEELDYDREMENMAYLYDMREVLSILNEEHVLKNLSNDQKFHNATNFKKNKYHNSRHHGCSKEQTMNYRKPKRTIQQPRTSHMMFTARSH
jgi:hypothetical protein